eukprot:PhM_4_TR11712/c3_g2_i8/m.29594
MGSCFSASSSSVSSSTPERKTNALGESAADDFSSPLAPPMFAPSTTTTASLSSAAPCMTHDHRNDSTAASESVGCPSTSSCAGTTSSSFLSPSSQQLQYPHQQSATMPGRMDRISSANVGVGEGSSSGGDSDLESPEKNSAPSDAAASSASSSTPAKIPSIRCVKFEESRKDSMMLEFDDDEAAKRASCISFSAIAQFDVSRESAAARERLENLLRKISSSSEVIDAEEILQMDNIATREVIRGRDIDGSKTVNEYVVLKRLGQGAHAKVKLVCRMDTEEFYAMKIIPKQRAQRRGPGFGGRKKNNGRSTLQNEVEIMKTLKHPNLVQLEEVLDSDDSEKMYLVMEYVSGGAVCQTPTRPYVSPSDHYELGDLCSLPNLRRQVYDMLCGLNFLHDHNIQHRDIKPDNVLVTEDGEVKLADFGVSAELVDDIASSCGGTPMFFAPEMYQQQSFYARPCDMWALGITVFMLAFQRTPFRDESITSRAALSRAICDDDVCCPTAAPRLLKDFIYRLLTKQPELRMTAWDALRHPLLSEHVPLTLSVRAWKEFKLARLSEADATKQLATFSVVLKDNTDKRRRTVVVPEVVVQHTPLLNASSSSSNAMMLASAMSNNSSSNVDGPTSPCGTLLRSHGSIASCLLTDTATTMSMSSFFENDATSSAAYDTHSSTNSYTGVSGGGAAGGGIRGRSLLSPFYNTDETSGLGTTNSMRRARYDQKAMTTATSSHNNCRAFPTEIDVFFADDPQDVLMSPSPISRRRNDSVCSFTSPPLTMKLMADRRQAGQSLSRMGSVASSIDHVTAAAAATRRHLAHQRGESFASNDDGGNNIYANDDDDGGEHDGDLSEIMVMDRESRRGTYC